MRTPDGHEAKIASVKGILCPPVASPGTPFLESDSSTLEPTYDDVIHQEDSLPASFPLSRMPIMESIHLFDLNSPPSLHTEQPSADGQKDEPLEYEAPKPEPPTTDPVQVVQPERVPEAPSRDQPKRYTMDDMVVVVDNPALNYFFSLLGTLSAATFGLIIHDLIKTHRIKNILKESKHP